MASIVKDSVIGTLFYFVIFFLVMGFIMTHMTLPFKLIGNLLKNPTSVANTDLTGTYKTLNSWGFITFLDGGLVVIAVVVVIFLWFAWKRCKNE